MLGQLGARSSSRSPGAAASCRRTAWLKNDRGDPVEELARALQRLDGVVEGRAAPGSPAIASTSAQLLGHAPLERGQVVLLPDLLEGRQPVGQGARGEERVLGQGMAGAPHVVRAFSPASHRRTRPCAQADRRPPYGGIPAPSEQGDRTLRAVDRITRLRGAPQSFWSWVASWAILSESQGAARPQQADGVWGNWQPDGFWLR